MILVDQWDGQPLARYQYNGGTALVWRPNGSPGGGNGSPRKVAPLSLIIETCYETAGYNYAPSDPSAGVSWTENLGCTDSFSPEVPGSELLDAAAYMIVVGGSSLAANPDAIYPGDGGIIDGQNLNFVFDTLPGIDLTKYFKCFIYISDQGATYSATLCADLPVDNNPGALLTSNFHPGHTFIILTKTNGTVSLSQSFDFYPESQQLSITGLFIQSKIKDDGAVDHEYDASLLMPKISQLDFQTIENMAVTLAGSQQYSLYDYNCTDYALQVFNSIRVNDPIIVSDWIGYYTGINFGTTPNGLYEQLVGMQTFFAGATNQNVKIGVMHASASSGPCN